jgi:hypothetical protein
MTPEDALAAFDLLNTDRCAELPIDNAGADAGGCRGSGEAGG